MFPDTAGLLELPTEEKPQEELLSLDATREVPQIEGQAADQRAFKYHTAMGNRSPGIPTIRNSILNGTEIDLRNNFAGMKEGQQQAEKADLLNTMASRGSVDPVAAKTIAQVKPVDPELVFEKEFGKAYSDFVVNQMYGNPQFSDYINKDPETTLDHADEVGRIAAKDLFFKKGAEDEQARVKKMGWGSYLYNIGESMIPFVSSYQLNAALNAPVSSFFLPGTTVRDQVQRLWMMPLEQGKEKYREIMDDLRSRNPLKALEFAHAVAALTSDKEALDNILAGADLAMLGGPLLTRLGKAFRGAKEAGATGRLLTAEEIERLKVQNAVIVGTDHGNRTVTTPRSITSSEIAQMNERMGTAPGPSELTPEGIRVLQERAKGLAPEEGKITGFTTARGSTYVVNPSGTTTRDKAPRPEHPGDSGPQPESVKTYYVTQENAQALAPPQGSFRVVEHDNALSIATRPEGGRWGIAPSQNRLPFGTTPREGMVPVEVWQPRKIMGTQVYDRVHFGNPITEVAREKRAATVTEPRFMSRKELDSIAERLGPRLLSPEEIRSMQGTFRGSVEGLAGPELKLENVLAGTGDVAGAARLRVEQQITNAGADAGNSNLKNKISDFFNPSPIMRDPGSFTTAAAGKVMDALNNNVDILLKSLTSVPRTQRTTVEALREGIAKAEAIVKHQMAGRGAESAIIRSNHEYDPLTNLHSVVFDIGKPDGTLFSSKNAAITMVNTRYKFGGLEQFAPVYDQQGAGWFIKIIKPVDETGTTVREALLINTENQTPRNWTNLILSWAKSSPYKTSTEQTAQRSTVAHGQQMMQHYISQVAEGIGDLSKKEKANLNTMTILNRDFISGMDRGHFYTTLGEFEREYRGLFGTMPSDKEARAYFAAKQLSDFDYIVRNMGYQRDLARQGIENWRTPYFKAGGDTRYVSEDFKGREVTEVPWGKPAGVLIVDQEAKTTKFYRANNAPKGAQSTVSEMLKDRQYRVIQVANPLERPLFELAKDYVHFVVVRDPQSKPLSWDMIPYRPGFHVEYDPNLHYTKQPIVKSIAGRNSYEGDNVIMAQRTGAEARKFTDRLEEARRLYNENKLEDLRTYLARNLPEDQFSFNQVVTRFQEGTWDPNETFRVVRSGRSTVDDYEVPIKSRYSSWIDETKSPFNLMQNVDKKFIGEKDQPLWTIKERGTETSPQLATEAAPTIDPLPTLYRALGNVTHSLLYNDYKVFHVESWIQEFHDVMNVSQEALRANPLYHLANPSWDKGADAVKLKAAQESRKALLSFIGTDSPDVQAMKYMRDKMLDSVYNSLGQRASDFVEESRLGQVNDPFRFFRSAAFQMKMGIFAAPNFLTQIQTAIHAVAIAGPVNGFKGLGAGTMAWTLRNTENPTIIARADKIAQTMGWKPGEFTEGLNQLKRSGWYEVQGETIWKNDVMEPNLIRTAKAKFLDAGLIFFREGERVSRLTGWFASMAEHNAQNPNFVWGASRLADDAALQRVLARASLMNMDMTRAAMSPWQQGAAAIPTQFMGYYARLTEQMIGKRLTPMEKARVMGTYAVMYGVPVGALVYSPAAAVIAGGSVLEDKGIRGIPEAAATAGAAFLGQWPMYDLIRTQAMEKGYDKNSLLNKFLLDGLPSTIMQAALGTDYDKKFAPQAPNNFRELMQGDKKWWEFLGGVAGETVADLGNSFDPIFRGISAAIQGKYSEFPLVLEDLVDPARNFTGLNVPIKAFYGAMWGKYITKNEVVVSDVTTMDNVMMAAFGLIRQDIGDVFRMADSMKMRTEAQKFAETQMKKELRRFVKAAVDDPDTADNHLRRAQTWGVLGDFSPEQLNKINADAMKGYEPLMDRIKRDFFIKKAPRSQIKARQQQQYGITPEEQ